MREGFEPSKLRVRQVRSLARNRLGYEPKRHRPLGHLIHQGAGAEKHVLHLVLPDPARMEILSVRPFAPAKVILYYFCFSVNIFPKESTPGKPGVHLFLTFVLFAVFFRICSRVTAVTTKG